MITEDEKTSGGRLQKGLSVALCLFVIAEVNYPLLQPQSRLALFGLLGLSLLFLHLPIRKSGHPGRWLRLSNGVLVVAALVGLGYVIVQTEPALARFWAGGTALGDRAGQEVGADHV
ncbi:MAG: hypothetical protein ACYTAS_21080, partial [Planctomycetota bacterium]